ASWLAYSAVRDRAEMRRADEGGVLLQHPAKRRALRPLCFSLRQLGPGDLQFEPRLRSVDENAIAIAHQRERAARRGLGRDIADHHAARGARETPVGQERDLLAHPLPVDERGDA